MHTLILNFPLFPKPRGILGRAGNIYHSSKPYKDFKKRVAAEIEAQLGAITEPIASQCYLGVFNGYTPFKRGSELDSNNIYGAVEDCLVQTGKLKDDKRKILVGHKIRCFPVGFEYNAIFIGQAREELMIDAIVMRLLTNAKLELSQAKLGEVVRLR